MKKFAFLMVLLWGTATLESVQAASNGAAFLLDNTVIYDGTEDDEDPAHLNTFKDYALMDFEQTPDFLCNGMMDADGWDHSELLDGWSHLGLLQETRYGDDTHTASAPQGQEAMSQQEAATCAQDDHPQPQQEDLTLKTLEAWKMTRQTNEAALPKFMKNESTELPPQQQENMSCDAQTHVTGAQQDAIPHAKTQQIKHLWQKAQEEYNTAAQRFVDNKAQASMLQKEEKAIVSELSKHPGKWLSVQEVFADTYKKTKGYFFYMRKVLALVFQGAPIEYDKKNQKVMLLAKPKRILTPQPGETIFTLVYDVHTRCKKKTCIEECAYYAHEYGYWQRGFRWHGGSKDIFYNYIEGCRWRLVVLGFLPKEVLEFSLQQQALYQADVWRLVQKKPGVLEDTAYRPYIQQKDIDYIKTLLAFSQTKEYQGLEEHAALHPREKMFPHTLKNFIREKLQKKAYRKETLILLCQKNKYFTGKDFWNAIYELAAEKGLGHLSYDFQSNTFYWDDKPHIDGPKEWCLTRIFQLEQVHRLPLAPVGTVLRQEGFSHVNNRDISVAERCLRLLGLKKDIGLVRNAEKQKKLINSMLKAGTKHIKSLKGIDTQDLLQWDIRACQEIITLVENKNLLRLLQFLHLNPEKAPQPPPGNQTLQAFALEKVIQEQIPELYNILCYQMFEEIHERALEEQEEQDGQKKRQAYEKVAQSFETLQVSLPTNLDALLQKMLFTWNKRRGEWIAVREIFPTLLNVPYRYMKKPEFYIKPLVRLVLDGVPILYDKGQQKLMLTGKKEIEAAGPKETLWTLIYDCFARHKNLSIEECAYYAHEHGYWQRGFHWHGGVKKIFYDYIEKCLCRLVILDFLQTNVLPLSYKEEVKTLISIWSQVLVDRTVHEARHYGPLVLQKDIDEIEEIRQFLQTQEYENLQEYIVSYQKKETSVGMLAKYIYKQVRERPYSKQELILVCDSNGFRIAGCFWDAVYLLVQEKGPGRVIYDYTRGDLLLWDYGCRPVVSQKKYLVRIFQLNHDYPKMSIDAIKATVMQEGFIILDEKDVHLAFKVLALLGLTGYTEDDKIIGKRRALADIMLKHHTQWGNDPGSHGPYGKRMSHSPYDKRICRKMLDYVQTKKVLQLLREGYLFLEHSEDSATALPPRKRRKKSQRNPAQIIMEDMPALHSILYSQISEGDPTRPVEPEKL